MGVNLKHEVLDDAVEVDAVIVLGRDKVQEVGGGDGHVGLVHLHSEVARSRVEDHLAILCHL